MTTTPAAQYSVKVFVTAERGPVEKWFATRLERTLWLLENGYSSIRIVTFSDPEHDARLSVFDVDDLPKPTSGGMNDTGISKGEKVMASYRVYRGGVFEGFRSVVLNVQTAWPMQDGLMFLSDGENHYAVVADSVRIAARGPVGSTGGREMTVTNEAAKSVPQERYTVHTHGSGNGEKFRVWDALKRRYVVSGYATDGTDFDFLSGAEAEIDLLTALDRLSRS